VVIEEFLKEWGEENPQKYFTDPAKNPQAMMAAGQPGQGGGPGSGQPALPPGSQNGVQGQNNMGVTSQTAVDATSPSATGGMSMSPALMAQRALALSSGPQNQ
jgi:hypothetical protein